MVTRSATDYDKHIAVRLRAARKQAGLSQTEAAETLGVAFQQVQKYELATNRISAGKLFQLAGVYGLPVAWFFDGLDRPAGTRLDSDLSIKLISAPHGASLARDFLSIDSVCQQAVAHVAAAFAVSAEAA